MADRILDSTTIQPSLMEEIEINPAPKTLRQLIHGALESYFSHIDKEMPPKNMYQMVVEEIEVPLLEATLIYTNGNQCQAAEILGISRSTLRKKLQQHNLSKV